MKLEQELRMSRFRDDFQRAYLNIVFTGNFLQSKMQQDLKKYNLTPPQFNVLRILRGQNGIPIGAFAIQDRMVHRTSNVTRIIEKLIDKKLVTRKNNPDNGRIVDILITKAGLKVINEADSIAQKAINDISNVLSEEQAREMADWLDAIRNIA
ncbi:MarR family transcriptional regulator [Taibaiella lutea]|uniref:MarR family transcriptional regulator n=1 Tax=Taibaiella lutea TaxID=2608001 RepID=A0A5M6CLV4_9BACT|nr:MarR family transcriptional regulator [Taibaiella lutea]KAA5536208.1 MarR family transcriptional regulator [Taibaiella lutea]